MKKFALLLLVVFLTAVSMSIVSAQEEPPGDATCTLSLLEQAVNHVDVKVTIQNAAYGTLYWPNGPAGGIDVGDGWSGGIDLDYNVTPDRAHQQLKMTIDGAICATLNVTIQEWITNEGGDGDGGTENPPGTVDVPASAISNPVTPGSKTSHCLQLNGWRDVEMPNRYHFTIKFQGENPGRVARLDFGDGSANDPERLFNSGTDEIVHDYDMTTLTAGVRVSLTPIFLGDWGVCMFADIDNNVTDFQVINGGNTYVNREG